ncbi:MAG: cyclic nucleotide-binding domain-containing protein [Chloroflexi bacterium]|nr:cyclic nucleotide-binding domain-containing protein [Chloroflexota bacterium]
MDLHRFLACLPVFAQLDPESIGRLLEEMESRKLAGGEVLFDQGQPGDAFYILLSGKLRVTAITSAGVEAAVGTLEAGDCIGEMALLTGQPRSATVSALAASELLCLTRPAFERLTGRNPGILSGLATQLLPRFQQMQASIYLSRLFGRLEEESQQQLLGQLGWRRLDSGETLFRQGEVGDEMYIIVQGRLRLIAEEADSCERVLGEVGAGEYVGEFVLLAEPGSPESKRTATLYATRQTDLLVISRSVFDSLLCRYPQALLNLARQMAQRSAKVARSAAWGENSMVIALIPARMEGTLEEFARRLAQALEQSGPTLVLDAASFERHYGRPGAAQTALDDPLSLVINAWLDEREREHRFTLYITAPTLDESGRLDAWSKRCVEDADLLLLVGEGHADPRPTAVERALPSTSSRSRLELVLVHDAGCQVPRGTTRWLEARRACEFPVQAWHHIREGNAADFRRLARRVAGTPIGLTLAGGGARGWAHVGVLRYMEEEGMEFDWVAGASMGAIVAGGCALEWSSGRIHELAAQFSDPRKLLDYTFPYASVTATRRITSMLQSLYAGADIEDTWRPFFCISLNLNEGRERIHTRGALWKAVRASMAFPGIFAPVADEGCVLIDGGAVNNLPVDRMRERCPSGTVIGVELVTGSPVRGEYEFGPSLSGWRLLFSRFLPASRRTRIPTMLNIIDGLVYSNTHYRLNEAWRSADLLVKVPVQEYALLEFDKYEQIIEAGYRAAREHFQGF